MTPTIPQIVVSTGRHSSASAVCVGADWLPPAWQLQSCAPEPQHQTRRRVQKHSNAPPPHNLLPPFPRPGTSWSVPPVSSPVWDVPTLGKACGLWGGVLRGATTDQLLYGRSQAVGKIASHFPQTEDSNNLVKEQSNIQAFVPANATLLQRRFSRCQLRRSFFQKG